MSLNRDFSGASIDAGFLFVSDSADSTPDQFSFASVTNATLATQYVANTDLTGIDNGQLVTVTNGEVSNDQGANWATTANMIQGSTLVRATLTSSVTNSVPVSVTVTVNTVSATFTVTTVAAQLAPDPFVFDNVIGAQLTTAYESVKPITGIDNGAVVACTGGQVSSDNGVTWRTSVAMVTGQTLVRAQLISNDNYSLQSGITVTVNGVSAIFTVTTKDAPAVIERTEDAAPASFYMNELEALNLLLRAIGTAPVNSVSAPQPDVAAARTALNRARNQAQQRGWWFNIDYNTTFTPVDNGILIPTSISSIVAVDRNYVKRGDKLYNRYTNSYVFTDPVVIHRLIRILDWDDMPDCMREHCAYLAAMWFVEDEISDIQKGQAFRDNATTALIAVSRRDLEEGQYSMYTSSRTMQARAGVQPYKLQLRP